METAMLLAGAAYRTAPAQVGRFTVDQVSEQRANGVIVEAHDPAGDQNVAIQLVRPGDDVSPADGLRRIAEALGHIRSPYIVRVHDVGVVEPYVYIAMERVQGRSVQGWLRTDRTGRSWRQTLRVFKQAALGLYAIHSAGYLHCDFTPASVLLGADGRVLVRDLGQLRPAGSSGALVGEPAYTAPEVIAGAPVDARADQFSFCATMFEALYGARPFRGDDPSQVALAGGERDPCRNVETAAAVGFDGPPRLLHVLRRGLREDPAGRWRDMMELLQEIDRAAPQEAGPRPRRRVAWGALFVLVLLPALARVCAPSKVDDQALRSCVSQR